jgi:hypothetical protein
MYDGIDYALKIRLDSIKELEGNDIDLFFDNIIRLDNILSEIRKEIDSGEARKQWCKTCTAEKRVSLVSLTDCMVCAIFSPFKQPLKYTGPETKIGDKKAKKVMNLVKSFNLIIKEVEQT